MKRMKVLQGLMTIVMLLVCVAPSSYAVEMTHPMNIDLEDGEYAIELDCVGGSGKANIISPALLIVRDAKAYVRLVWSSSNYDYMLVGSEKYLNQAGEDENSVFEVPLTVMDMPMEVAGDTTAMGTPHEITYFLTFHSDTIAGKETLPQEAAKRMVLIALVIIVGGGILNAFVKKKMR